MKNKIVKTFDICINCICLPVCISKNYTATARDCVLVRRIFIEVAKKVMFGDDVNVYFLRLDKTYFVNCDSCNISVGMISDTQRHMHYLFNYPYEHIVDDADLNVNGFFPHL